MEVGEYLAKKQQNLADTRFKFHFIQESYQHKLKRDTISPKRQPNAPVKLNPYPRPATQ